MTDSELLDLARELARRMFEATGATANLNLNDLKAAVGTIDTAMNLTTDQVATNASGIKLELALAGALPEPFKSTATVAQKSMALAVWAMKRGGLI